MNRYRCVLPAFVGVLLCAAFADAQTSPASPGRLPEAPSASMALVNGRPYRQPTARQNFIAYRQEMIGPRPFISAAVRSGIEQARTVPVGWGQDFPGYLQRYGSAYGEAAIDSSVRFAMGAALHEDVRYLLCHHCNFGGKLANAALAEVTARHGSDGHRTFSPTPIVSAFSGPMIAYAAWYPPGYTERQAAGHAFLGIGTRIVFRMVREYVFDRDTPAEKAAKKADQSQTAKP